MIIFNHVYYNLEPFILLSTDTWKPKMALLFVFKVKKMLWVASPPKNYTKIPKKVKIDGLPIPKGRDL